MSNCYAQGKVLFSIEGNSPICLSNAPSTLYAADASLAGQPIPTTGPLPSGSILVAGLYAGTRPDSLSLQTNVVINPSGGTGCDAGMIPSTKVTLVGVPGGTTAYFQVKIWESKYSTYESAVGGYKGVGVPFSMIPGSSVAYVTLWQGGSTTWVIEPIYVSAVTEPPFPQAPTLAVSYAAGQLTIGFSAEAGRSYSLQSSIDLGVWSSIVTNTATTAGPMEFLLPTGAAPRVFYRVIAR